MIRLGWAVALIMLAAEIHLMLAYFIRSRSLPGGDDNTAFLSFSLPLLMSDIRS